MSIFYLILIGVLAGFLSGLMGVGGGVVMVPLMVFLLGFTQHEAQGTSLAVLAVPVTFIAAYNYYQDGSLNWKYAMIMAVCFIFGAYLGSKLAISIDEKMLKKIFGGLMLLLSLKLILEK
ncbi:MAG: sulfite exporter TauE/SafE family protein [Bacteroidota bacterium]